MLRRAQQQEAEAAASENTLAVQQDWRDREFVASVQLGLSQLSAFLNDFGQRAPSLSTPAPSAALSPTVASSLSSPRR